MKKKWQTSEKKTQTSLRSHKKTKVVKKVAKSEKRSQTCKKSDKEWVTSVQMLETSEKMSQKVTN